MLQKMENSWTEGSDDSWMTASAAGAVETNLAKIYNIHHQASWSDSTQEEETPSFMSHDITQRKHGRAASTFGKYHLGLVQIRHSYVHTNSPGDNLQVSHSDLVRRLVDGLKKKKKKKQTGRLWETSVQKFYQINCVQECHCFTDSGCLDVSTDQVVRCMATTYFVSEL